MSSISKNSSSANPTALQEAAARNAGATSEAAPVSKGPKVDPKIADITGNRLVKSDVLDGKFDQTLADGTVVDANPSTRQPGGRSGQSVVVDLPGADGLIESLYGDARRSTTPGQLETSTGKGDSGEAPVNLLAQARQDALRETYRGSAGDRRSQSMDGEAAAAPAATPPATPPATSWWEAIKAAVASAATKAIETAKDMIPGAAGTILTANTGSPDDKANEFIGWVAVTNPKARAAKILDEAADYEKHNPSPDGTDSSPGTDAALNQFWATAKALGHTEHVRPVFGQSLISQPGHDGEILPPRESLTQPTLGSNTRRDWATNPGPEGDSGGVKPAGEFVPPPTPGVKDPPKPGADPAKPGQPRA